MEEKRIKPIVLTSETGRKYTLEFDRKSVKYAEEHGLDIQGITNGTKIMSGVSDLFHFAFRMHHPEIGKAESDKILFDDLGGVSTDFVGRLVELYNFPYNALLRSDDSSKNSRMTVEM